MSFSAAAASSLAFKAIPTAPMLEDLLEAFPGLQRALYSQALALAGSVSPALQACACAQLCSLLHEDFAARDDARIIAARLAAALGLPALGTHLLGSGSAASRVHQQAIAQVRHSLAQTPERSLTSWPEGLANIAGAVVDSMRTAGSPWLAMGPSSALAVLYGPADSRFSLTVLHPAALQARFGASMPPACVIAEPDLDPSGIAQLLNAYSSLPFTTLICASRTPHMPQVPGFTAAARQVEVPANAPLFLGHPMYAQSRKFSPEGSAGSERSAVALHVWKREK